MMEIYLVNAKHALRCRDYDARRRALMWLSMALGEAKKTGQGYAAGRILTAIQWAKLVKLPVS